MRSFVRYSLLAGCFTLVAVGLSRFAIQQGQLWQFVAVSLLIAAPTLTAMLYTDTVAIIHKSTRLRAGSHLMRFTTSRILSTIVWVIWSVAVGGWTLLWLHGAGPVEWAFLTVSIFLLYLLNSLVLPIARAQFAAYCATAEALRVVRILTAALVAPTYLLAHHYLIAVDQPARSLSSQLETIIHSPLIPDHSYLVQLAVRAHEQFQVLQDYVVLQFTAASPWFALLTVVGTFALFYNFSLLQSALLIPGDEYRRTFAPIEVAEQPRPVSMSSIVFTSTLATLFAFALFPVAAHLELYLRYQQEPLEKFRSAQSQVLHFADSIDGVLYKPGTIREIEELQAAGLRAQAKLVPRVQRQGKLAFDQMRANVDLFLDSYYSLGAEYLRVLGALTGNAEAVITEQLTATLLSGDELRKLDHLVASAADLSPEINSEYQRQLADLLDRNRIKSPQENTTILNSSRLNLLASLPEQPALTSVNQRMGASGVAAIGGVIVAKIVSKTAAKGGIKLAAKGLTKVAATKAASGPVGAVAGAAVGSVVPVVGTAIGSVIGFGVGAVLGISTDALLLTLEEHYSRDEFRAQIIAAIDEQEVEFNALLNNPGS